MPVSLAVCETANVVNAALRESLGVGGGCVAATASRAGVGGITASGSSADEARIGDNSVSDDNLQTQIVANAKRVLLAKIEYEEVENYHDSVLTQLKSKYIVITPDSSGSPIIASPNGTYIKMNGKVMGSNGHVAVADNNGNGNASANGNGNVNVNTNGNNTGNGNRKVALQSVEQSNQNELPMPKRVLYPRENIRIGWKQSDRKWQVGTGMLNVGNTCYLNSTLQALFHIPALANWLVSESAHVENCNISESCGGTGCIICAMAKTLLSTQSNQSAVRPFLIYSKLRQICKHIVVGRQEDAHEFLRFLVESMEKAYLMRFRNYKELDQLVKETTPLNQIFGGYLRSEVRCLSCNHVSITFQHFQDLLLDIRKADTLEEAFDGYFSRERLEDMGYKCEGCKKKVSATKQFSLERAPITLCIQLKRFSMMGNKLTKQITFKPRIDLGRFAARSPQAASQQLTYRLVSMVTHLGVSQHCGHYTAIGLSEAGSYYNFDDSYVRAIAMQSVCNTNAYIMFYELDLPSSNNNNNTNNKMNGLRLTNGQQQHSPPAVAMPLSVTVPATVTSTSGSAVSPRFIGPQLPNGYANSNGHTLLGDVKTAVQYKSPQQPQQNGLLVGASKFQEKHSLAPPNANKSSCNNSNSTLNNTSSSHQQQHILPMSSDEEEDDDKFKANTAPQLPSMPKMFDDSNESVVQTAKLKPKMPLKSLVPYESASEEEEQQQQQQQQLQTTNVRKRRIGADSSDSEVDAQSLRNGHAKTNGSSDSGNGGKAPSGNVNINKQKTDAIDEIFRSLNHYKQKTTASEAEEQKELLRKAATLANGWQSQNGNGSGNGNGKVQGSPKTPPSPAVIKSKTGIWQVTRTDAKNDAEVANHEMGNDEVTSSVEDPQNLLAAKNHKNPFAASKELITSPCAKRQKMLNGNPRVQPRTGNGYQTESVSNGSAVSELLKQTHRGYGGSILSWNGKPSELEKELLAEALDQRKRDDDDDEENEMDRGRQRKIKSASVQCNNSAPGYNPFQEYEGQKRWQNNNTNSSSFTRYYHQNYRPNFQQRNKFKYNRFAATNGAKFKQQRALQRHLASGGGFTRRRESPAGQQQQQQS